MALYSNLGEVEDGGRTLSPSHDLTDAPNAPQLIVNEGKIEFDGISFAYGHNVNGVDNISLTIAPGQKVGVVGASGAGKSTLVSLLLRLYDTENGVVRIDNQDLCAVTQESLRRQIGMVTQETALFNRSARDNILYGRADASEAALIDAAKQAEAHEFILLLRDHKGRIGYDAHLGEQGVKLSGGQRQRIALARAILKNAPILVLDEATSALDAQTEAAVQAAIESLRGQRTIFLVAHRLSTIRHADRIVVLDQGRIAQLGNHEALVSVPGLYRDLIGSQAA